MATDTSSPFSDLRWLSAFHSDRARLAAIGLVCFTLIALYCVPTLARIWAADRADQRAHERRKLGFMAAADEALARRKAERLKLDD